MINSTSNHEAQLLERMKSWGADQSLLVANSTGSIVVACAHSQAFEGYGQPLPRPVLGMCTAGGGRIWKKGVDYHLDDVWHPGKVGLATPSPAMLGYTPEMSGVFI
ncbi:MAG: hypothetical protein AAGA50_09390, partial [Pseudomonadota bacterium]